MAGLVRKVAILVFAGKFERLSVGQVMEGMKVKDCVWLRNVQCQKEREHRMAQLLWWVFASYLPILINTFFYLTDTSALRRRVLFYRKHTWLTLQSRAVKEFRGATKCQGISKTTAEEMVASGTIWGNIYVYMYWGRTAQ
jgi:hypothetical protein